MKKTKSEILEQSAIKEINKAKKILSWNLDITFAKLMLPIIKEYYKKSEETFYTWSITMPNFLRKRLDCNKSKLTEKIKNYYHNKYKKHMEDLINALEDILIEGSDKWEKKWNIKPFMKIEYDSIPYKQNNKDEVELFEMKIKEEYKENDKINRKNIPYNIKQTNKCYKWRQKQLNWFIKNITKLWW